MENFIKKYRNVHIGVCEYRIGEFVKNKSNTPPYLFVHYTNVLTNEREYKYFSIRFLAESFKKRIENEIIKNVATA